jgi:hypothetical protein
MRVGYELVCDCRQRIPIISKLHIHSTRVSDVIVLPGTKHDSRWTQRHR